MDEVTVTILPHPITTFILGIVLFSIIFLYMEFKRLRNEVSNFNRAVDKLEESLEKTIKEADSKIEEVSKKVDSRVDKAISALKKSSI